MTKEQEEKRDRLKRWYSDQGHPMTSFIKDVQATQEIHRLPDLGAAIDHLYAEMDALGNFKGAVDSGERKA